MFLVSVAQGAIECDHEFGNGAGGAGQQSMRPAAARGGEVGVVTGKIGDGKGVEEGRIGVGILDAGEVTGGKQFARRFGVRSAW